MNIGGDTFTLFVGVGIAAGAMVAARAVQTLDRIAGAFEAMEDEARRACYGVERISDKLAPASRLAEVQLERLDRARPAIATWSPDCGEAMGGRASVLPVSAPLAPVDVPCPACAGKFPADQTCKLCFGSNVTSAAAAADWYTLGVPPVDPVYGSMKKALQNYEQAQGLEGSF